MMRESVLAYKGTLLAIVIVTVAIVFLEGGGS